MRTATRLQILLYLTPALLLTLLFFALPLTFVGYMTFHSWDGIGPILYVGLQNITSLIHDPSFNKAFINSIIWILVGLFIHLPFALLIALILSHRPRGWRFFRNVFVLPNVISTTAVAFLWYFVFQVDIGLLNGILGAVGLGGLARPWLFDPHTALAATQAPFVLYIGFTMLIFLTQISTIPADYYEAARIDGASAWQIDWHITIPLVRPAVAINALFITGFCLRMFEYPFIMTSGGPMDATLNLSLYIYRSMVTAHAYGLSMAAGSATILLGIAVMALVFLALRRAGGRPAEA
ncbi:MAG TPA: sugar ABC transporter permease [Chloroflexota bacterium]|nr:sugar ABC transporter permease [Chloroflexota bacterium]